MAPVVISIKSGVSPSSRPASNQAVILFPAGILRSSHFRRASFCPSSTNRSPGGPLHQSGRFIFPTANPNQETAALLPSPFQSFLPASDNFFRHPPYPAKNRRPVLHQLPSDDFPSVRFFFNEQKSGVRSSQSPSSRPRPASQTAKRPRSQAIHFPFRFPNFQNNTPLIHLPIAIGNSSVSDAIPSAIQDGNLLRLAFVSSKTGEPDPLRSVSAKKQGAEFEQPSVFQFSTEQILCEIPRSAIHHSRASSRNRSFRPREETGSYFPIWFRGRL